MAETLTAARAAILGRWLEAARQQPFHAAQPERAVADHIPHLFDALVAFLRRYAPREVDPRSPLDDEAVRAAARAHASDRFRQGLAAADVLTEFRLLRQEIGRALRERANGAGDMLAAELLVHDALDGATTLAVAALEAHAAEYHRAAAELAAIVASSSDAIIGKTLEGIMTSWNPGAERLYGYTAAEAVGQPMSLIIPPDRPDELPSRPEWKQHCRPGAGHGDRSAGQGIGCLRIDRADEVRAAVVLAPEARSLTGTGFSLLCGLFRLRRPRHFSLPCRAQDRQPHCPQVAGRDLGLPAESPRQPGPELLFAPVPVADGPKRAPHLHGIQSEGRAHDLHLAWA